MQAWVTTLHKCNINHVVHNRLQCACNHQSKARKHNHNPSQSYIYKVYVCYATCGVAHFMLSADVIRKHHQRTYKRPITWAGRPTVAAKCFAALPPVVRRGNRVRWPTRFIRIKHLIYPTSSSSQSSLTLSHSSAPLPIVTGHFAYMCVFDMHFIYILSRQNICQAPTPKHI